jgi:hypothetical protein
MMPVELHERISEFFLFGPTAHRFSGAEKSSNSLLASAATLFGPKSLGDEGALP